MRRILVLVLCLVILLSLCGCAFKEAVSAEAEEFLITALGFDEVPEGISVYFEAVIVNSEDSEADSKVKLIEGKGETVAAAVSNAAQKSVNPFLLNHLGALVIGKSVSADRFKEICEYCYDEDNINLAARFVSADNAKALLSGEAVSSVAIGYDILSMLSSKAETSGLELKNRFYEVESLREKPVRVMALPYFTVAEGEFYCDGLLIYNNLSPVLLLNSVQSFYYAVATDSQASGRVLVKKEEYKVNSCYSEVDFKKEGGVTAFLTVKLKSENNALPKESLKNGITELFELSKQKELDVFGLGNIMYSRKRELFVDLNKNYTESYKKINLTVEFKE